MRFSMLFYEILKKQLILKNIITEEDWNSWKHDLNVDYLRDNHFAELKEAELLREKLQSLDQVSNYVGEYFSKEWVQKNVFLRCFKFISWIGFYVRHLDQWWT